MFDLIKVWYLFMLHTNAKYDASAGAIKSNVWKTKQMPKCESEFDWSDHIYLNISYNSQYLPSET